MLRFVSRDAAHTLPVHRQFKIGIFGDRISQPLGNGFGVHGEGASLDMGPDRFDLAYALLKLVHESALRDMAGYVRIHAACADYRGSRFIVIGEKGAGKTTLMLKLLSRGNGFRVNGDEMVLVRDGMALPFPRRFHVKRGFKELFRNLTPRIEDSPSLPVPGGHTLKAFSPKEAGFDWEIDERPIRAICCLTPNHGKKTRILSCSGLAMLREIMPMTFLSEEGDHRKIGGLCRLINTVETRRLLVGDLDGAVSALEDLLGDPAARQRESSRQ